MYTSNGNSETCKGETEFIIIVINSIDRIRTCIPSQGEPLYIRKVALVAFCVCVVSTL